MFFIIFLTLGADSPPTTLDSPYFPAFVQTLTNEHLCIFLTCTLTHILVSPIFFSPSYQPVIHHRFLSLRCVFARIWKRMCPVTEMMEWGYFLWWQILRLSRKDNPENCTGVIGQSLAKHLPGVYHNCRKQSRALCTRQLLAEETYKPGEKQLQLCWCFIKTYMEKCFLSHQKHKGKQTFPFIFF